MNRPIRILVADDHPIVREGLVAILGTQPDLLVVAEAADGLAAAELEAELTPDVILLDLEMPRLDGLGALRLIRERNPEAKAIIFTVFDTDERIVEAIRGGARGYLLKGSPRDEIFQAVRTVHQGGSLLQPTVASSVLRYISGESRRDPLTLTPRELEVLRLLATGRTNRDIADELTISERTAKFHVSAILGKLGAANRTEAVAIATKNSLLP